MKTIKTNFFKKKYNGNFNTMHEVSKSQAPMCNDRGYNVRVLIIVLTATSIRHYLDIEKKT